MKIIWKIMLLCLAFCTLVGCTDNSSGQDEETGIQVYYLNREETTIRYQEYELVAEDTQEAIGEVLGYMKTAPDKQELKASPFAEIDVLGYTVEGEKVTLNLASDYKKLVPTTEILLRAALVRSLTQIPGIQFVSFEVEGSPLTDARGEVVGLLNASQFVDNEGSQINNYETVTLKLYYANEDGNCLIPVSRTVEYNTNISLAYLVTEQLIAGPAVGEDAYPVMNPATGIISVIVKDGTCYVNLNENFLTQVYNVNSEVTIYSIANSIIALNNVNKVQIMVNGNSEITYRESMSLSNAFERNLDIVEQ